MQDRDFIAEIVDESARQTPEFDRILADAVSARERLSAVRQLRRKFGFTAGQIARVSGLNMYHIPEIEIGDAEAAEIERYIAAVDTLHAEWVAMARSSGDA